MTIHVPPQTPSAPPPVPIAFVGEAPSDEELEQRIPLVGPSGRHFNALLKSAGIRRDRCLVTNVFDEKLPGNDVASWTIPLKEARALGCTDVPPIGKSGFLAPRHRWHLDRLAQELAQWQPHVIVPLGGTALWALTGQSSISAMRGTVLAATQLMPGAKLIPTFHPATLFHSWKYWSVIIGDLEKARDEADRGPQIVLANRELLLEPTLDELRAYVAGPLARSDLLSVDIETGWNQLTCIGFAPDAERGICVPFVDRRSPNNSYWPDPQTELEAWKLVREVLASPVPKVGQNFGGYDFYWLLQKYRLPVRNLIHDTRLLHHALYPELEKSLEFMGNSYANQGAWKFWGRKAQEKRDA